MRRIEQGAGALADYRAWFGQAEHGETLIYHVGDLQFDRDQDCVAPTERTRAGALSALATRILNDAQAGYLVLTQRRLGNSCFEYRAARKRSGSEPRSTKVRLRADYLPG